MALSIMHWFGKLAGISFKVDSLPLGAKPRSIAAEDST